MTIPWRRISKHGSVKEPAYGLMSQDGYEDGHPVNQVKVQDVEEHGHPSEGEQRRGARQRGILIKSGEESIEGPIVMRRNCNDGGYFSTSKNRISVFSRLGWGWIFPVTHLPNP